MTAAVATVSVPRTRLRAEAPSRSNANCSPSCRGLVAPAARAFSVSRAAKAFLSSEACMRAGWPRSLISTAAAKSAIMTSPAGVGVPADAHPDTATTVRPDFACFEKSN